MTDLDRLIAVVEAGALTEPEAPALTLEVSRLLESALGDLWESQWDNVVMAHDGSLDAALALKEALLPGWQYHLSDGTATVEGSAWQFYQQSTSTARAWLLAILRARAAQRGE